MRSVENQSAFVTEVTAHSARPAVATTDVKVAADEKLPMSTSTDPPESGRARGVTATTKGVRASTSSMPV